jgi:hypothetical protein
MEAASMKAAAFFNLHDLITLKISGLSGWVFPDLNTKFSFFQVDFVRSPDISVEIGPFKPQLDGTSAVEQRYFIKPGYLYFREEDKGLSWEAEIQWMKNGQISIRYFAPLSNRFKWPWTFFPEMVLHLYILIPLIEEMLIQKGWFLLHAGAAAKDDKAVLWIGRGGTYKTTFTLRSLNKGYQLLGDDFVLVKGQQVFSFPTSPVWLEFTHRYLKYEQMTFLDQFRLAGYLAAHQKTALPFIQSAALERAEILLACDADFSESGSLTRTQDEKIEMIITNQLLERNAYVSYRYRIGQFLEVYDYVCPGIRGIPFEQGIRDLARKSFASIPLEIRRVRLDIPHSIQDNTCLL